MSIKCSEDADTVVVRAHPPLQAVLAGEPDGNHHCGWKIAL